MTDTSEFVFWSLLLQFNNYSGDKVPMTWLLILVWVYVGIWYKCLHQCLGKEAFNEITLGLTINIVTLHSSPMKLGKKIVGPLSGQ